MDRINKILTAAVLSASIGLGAQSIFAQSAADEKAPPGSPQRPGPLVVQPGPEVQPLPGQPAPGLPSPDPIPGQPGTIPERTQKPRAGVDRDRVVSSAEIMKAQQALRAKGLNPGEDGKLDAQTQQALRQFQKNNDLPATGALDRKTAEKLGVTIDSDKPMPQHGSGSTSTGSGKSGVTPAAPTSTESVP